LNIYGDQRKGGLLKFNIQFRIVVISIELRLSTFQFKIAYLFGCFIFNLNDFNHILSTDESPPDLLDSVGSFRY